MELHLSSRLVLLIQISLAGADMEKLQGLVARPMGILEVPYGEKHGLMLDWNHAGMDGNPQKL